MAFYFGPPQNLANHCRPRQAPRRPDRLLRRAPSFDHQQRLLSAALPLPGRNRNIWTWIGAVFAMMALTTAVWYFRGGYDEPRLVPRQARLSPRVFLHAR